MIRITTSDDPAYTTITVDGQLLGNYVETIEMCCAQALLKDKPVRFLLRDVSRIDERARSMLHRLARKGVELQATGIYSSYLIDGIKSSHGGALTPLHV